MVEETLKESQWGAQAKKGTKMENERRWEWKPVEEKKGTKMEKQMTNKACAKEEWKKTNEEDEGREIVGCTDGEEARKKKSFFF